MKMLNQQVIKENNLKQIFSMIADHKGISRARLAAATGLSKSTVSVLVEELLEQGYLIDEGTVNVGGQGRKPNSLRVNGEGNRIAVIHWHRKRMHLGLVGLDGKMYHFRSRMFAQEED